VDANAGIALFTEGCADWLLAPPVNALRLSLHPEGMAPRIANLAQWRAHLLHRLQRQASASAEPELAELHAELSSYPAPSTVDEAVPSEADRLVVPLRYRHGDRELSFFSTTAVLGTPLDVTLAELAIESFFPADAPTAAYLNRRLPA
jgi:hypothetical protein